MRFFLEASQSPTYYNLSRYLQEQGWRKTRFSWWANFSDENLRFDLKTAEQLEFKHLFAQLIEQYCPEAMPQTYCVNDHNWPRILTQLAQEHYEKNQQILDKIGHLAWILKPALLNNGKEIKIFQSLSELEQHFLGSQRLGGDHVLQRYLSPHLLRDARKYSIRMFVILSNYAGNFLYPFGYYNVAQHRYAEGNYQDLRSHLTNEHLDDEGANVLQIPTEQFAAFKDLYPQIKALVTATLSGLEQLHPQAFTGDKKRRLAIYGFDFQVDTTGRLWLLEANHGPCFPISDEHPLQRYLYYDFWQAFIANFVKPIAEEQALDLINYYPFERLLTKDK